MIKEDRSIPSGISFIRTFTFTCLRPLAPITIITTTVRASCAASTGQYGIFYFLAPALT